MIIRIFVLLGLICSLTVGNAAPSDYRFVSVYRANSAINAFGAAGGSINNNGTIVVALDPAGPDGQIVYRVDGPLWTEVWQADFGSQSRFNLLDINDVDQIAGNLNFGGTSGRIDLNRLAPNGDVTTLATRVFQCPNLDEFCNFGNIGDGLNNFGLVTITASRNHGAGPENGVWLFGNGAPIEIARQDSVNPGGLLNFTVPSINSSDVVAFGAAEVDIPGSHVYTGTGGPVTEEGTPPLPQGGGVSQALINDNFVFGVNANGIHVLENGVVTTVLPAQFAISGPTSLSFNNNAELAYLGCIDTVCGVFTGSDPEANAVLRNGDPLFGGNVTGGGAGAFRFGANNLNDNGDITFKVQISGVQLVSHLVRAIPLSAAYDADDDGVANDVDNCLAAANPLQRDTDGDGFGNLCDADFNNDGVVNFVDLGQMKAVFFSNDADADLNGDGFVNFGDLGIMKLRFFLPPGPSALVE